MKFNFLFKHMDTSEALKEYTIEKLTDRIEKFASKAIEANISFSVEKNHHTAHCTLIAGDGFRFEVEHSCLDMYAAVDKITAKLGARLKRQKEKLKNHRVPHPEPIIVSEHDVEELSAEAE
jgi:ribosomal subunit interface protein